MIWPGWHNLPAVKPLAVLGVLFAVGVIVRYSAVGADIPDNISSLVDKLLMASFGIYGVKSTIEHGIDKLSDKPWRKNQDEE